VKVLPLVAIDSPGSAGLDLVSAGEQAAPGSARRLTNLDCWTGAAPRVRPRGRLRRWGAYQRITTAISGGAGALTGDYKWRWRHDDGAGLITYGAVMGAALTLAGERATVSGWLTTSGTVAIYRTAAGGSTYKLVTAAHAATTPTYSDNTVDGSLGATLSVANLMGAMDDGLADQTHLVHFIDVGKNKTETRRLLLIRTDDGLYSAYPDGYSPYDEGTLFRLGGGGGTTRPDDFAVLGDLWWLARTQTTLGYTTGTTDLTALAQHAQPTLSVSTNAGVGVTIATSWIYVCVAVNLTTGVRSIPSAPQTVAAGTYLSVSVTPGSISSYSTHKVEIYRTSDGGAYFQYLTTRTSGGAYTDTTADNDLSARTLNFETAGVPDSGFNLIAAHKGLLFGFNRRSNTGVEAAPCLLQWTGPDPYNFPSDPFAAVDYQRQIEEDDGDEGTGIFSWGEVLALFKRRRVYALTGDPPTGFRFAAVPGSQGLGCVSHRTVVETPVGLIYLSPRGVCILPSPGASPIVASAALRDLLVESERDAAFDTQEAETASVERPSISFSVKNTTAAPATVEIRVQLDIDSAFGSIDYDYVTTDAAERPYFLEGNAAFPAGGVTIPGLGVRRITLTPPAITAGVYAVRYSTDAGATWTALNRTLTIPAGDVSTDRVNWGDIVWAFAVHYPARSQYWLWLPTADRKWCDRCYILNYGPMLEGGGPVWTGPHWIPATAGCLVEAMSVEGGAEQDYLLLAHPDGFLFLYPHVQTVWDHETRSGMALADRAVVATVSGGTVTASATSWPTADYGLRGTMAVLRDLAGDTFSGIVTANTATTLTVVWLGGRTPTAGACTVVVGGLETEYEGPWLNVAGERDEIAVLREVILHTGPERARLQLDVDAAATATRKRRPDTPTKSVAAYLGEDAEGARQEIGLGGKLHRVRLSGLVPQEYEITRMELASEPTGSST